MEPPVCYEKQDDYPQARRREFFTTTVTDIVGKQPGVFAK